MGRWINRDPIGEDGGVKETGAMNYNLLYGFVDNDAVNKVDLLGLKDYWIGGAADKHTFFGFGATNLVETIVMNAYEGKAAGAPRLAGKDKSYGYEDIDAIIKDIEDTHKKNPCEVVNLVGHSYGGAAAIDITAQLKAKKIRVNVLITLDPVAMFPRSNPDNFNIWVNVYQATGYTDILASIPVFGQGAAGLWSLLGLPGESHDISDVIATAGGQLGSESGATVNAPRDYHHWEAHKFFDDAIKWVPAKIRNFKSMDHTQYFKK